MRTIEQCFDSQYRGLKVLVTGHTGFKGSWLTLWLQKLGANVVGYSNPAPTSPNHFQLLNLDVESHIGDIRDSHSLQAVVKQAKPDIVFHLAAQPLVRLSYDQPIETITSNVTGTLNVLESLKGVDSVRAMICVTSDKVYLNKESLSGYRESDRLGGADPYSCSKACAELVTESFRQSYFPANRYGDEHHLLISTARAGNVIGGGDWADDRIVADIARATANETTTQIRNPTAVRPWQHVLEPLSGYLLLGERLLKKDTNAGQAWNFGPSPEGIQCVAHLVGEMQKHWQQIKLQNVGEADPPKETNLLLLDSTKAETQLDWTPVWEFEKTVEVVTDWYKSYYNASEVKTERNLDEYIRDASRKSIAWASNQQASI